MALLVLSAGARCALYDGAWRRVTVGDQTLEDTMAFTYGSRPLPSGLCLGVEEAMAGMRAGAVLYCLRVFPRLVSRRGGRP